MKNKEDSQIIRFINVLAKISLICERDKYCLTHVSELVKRIEKSNTESLHIFELPDIIKSQHLRNFCQNRM